MIKRVTRRVPLEEQELLTLQENLFSPEDFSRVCIAIIFRFLLVGKDMDVNEHERLSNITFSGTLYMFHVIPLSYIASINKQTQILKSIGQWDDKHIMTLHIKMITSALKVLTYIITSITDCPIRLADILALMYVSTLLIVVILYIGPRSTKQSIFILRFCKIVIFFIWNKN
jgi:hypothetical protein